MNEFDYTIKIIDSMIYILLDGRHGMGRQETQFLKRAAGGVGLQADDKIGSGGPGRSYRKGITPAGLPRLFPNDEAARERFEAAVWPDGPARPRCHSVGGVRPSTHPAMPHPQPARIGAYPRGAASGRPHTPPCRTGARGASGASA